MKLNVINEQETMDFIYEILSYYSMIDANSHTIIYTSQTIKPERNLAGWYHYVNGNHEIHINVNNLLLLKQVVDAGIIDIRDYYAFITLCVGHEFRHFLQARANKDGVKLPGYGQKDAFLDELIIYIKMFFDRYYLLNKGYLKIELDAECFAIKEASKFFNSCFSEFDGNRAIINAVNYYAYIQKSRGLVSSVPSNCKTIEEIVSKINEQILKNQRIPNLKETLSFSDERCLMLQHYFGLDSYKLLTNVLERYVSLNDGSKQDFLIVKEILTSINNPEETLIAFPQLQKKYNHLR